MVTLTIENYVKAIYQICCEEGQQLASNGDIARRLGVAPGTVTSMLRTLSESGLVDYQTHRGAMLTESGNKLALRVLRRHRLIELFLTKTLGLSWDEVHEEAENLEHAVSERLADRIDEFLGFPERDPHGDPIPQSDGSINIEEPTGLINVPVGAKFALVRVTDQSPEFLRYLSQSGLAMETEGVVESSQSESGAMVVQTASGKQIVLGTDAAEKLLVQLID